jgi:hypothetical protein
VPALLSLLSLPAAAAPDAPSWTVSVDPLTAALGFAHVQVERAVHPRASVYAGPHLRLYDGVLPAVNGPYVGLGGELGVRGFFAGAAPEGGWVMVRGVLARVATTEGPAEARLGGYTSALVGGTAILGPGVVLSGGAGASWFAYEVGGYGPSGPAVALHTAVGWAFGR